MFRTMCFTKAVASIDDLDPARRLAEQLEPSHLAHGVVRGAVGGLEGGEVVAPDQVDRRRAHRADVERVEELPGLQPRPRGARVGRFSMT